MLHDSAAFQQIQDTVIAYMRGARRFNEAQSVIEAHLQDLMDEIAREMRDEFDANSFQESLEERERHKRSVYAQLMIGAGCQARDDGSSLGTKRIAKLLSLMCWMCDSANELEKHRSPPTASEAA